MRNGLKAIAQRITRRMIRSANSFIVKEMEDCSASIFDAQGQLLAEEAGPPIQLNTVGVCLKTILEHYFPLERWKPGDVVITNDPYAGDGSIAATHTNDYLAFHPLFHDGELVAFSGLMVHHFDIGGMNMGTRGWGTEIYQEGLRIPPLKIIEEGELDGKVLDIILTNTRTREMLENDLMSQISSVKVAADDVLAALPQVRQRDDAGVLRASSSTTRSGARARRWRAIPDGVYRHEEPLLDDGAKGGPYWLRLALTKSRRQRDARLHRHRCAGQGPDQQPARDDARGGVLRDALRDRRVDPEHRRLQAADRDHRAAGHARQCAQPGRRLPADDRVPLDRRPRDGRARAGGARARDGRLLRVPVQLHDRDASRKRAGAPCSAKSCRAASARRRAPTASKSSRATSPTATSRRPRRSRWSRRCSTCGARCAPTRAGRARIAAASGRC